MVITDFFFCNRLETFGLTQFCITDSCYNSTECSIKAGLIKFEKLINITVSIAENGIAKQRLTYKVCINLLYESA